MMQKRLLGKSKIEVGALGMGCMSIGGSMQRGETATEHLFYLGEVDDRESLRALHCAKEGGVTFYDTAAAYGVGHSERLLGQAFAHQRDQVVLATKFGKRIDEEKHWFGFYANHDEVIRNIRQECESSLRRLNTDYIDLYQLHLPDFPLDRAGEARDILESLVAEGKIRFYCWSIDNPERAAFFAQGAHGTAVQFHLNVLEDAPEMLTLCDTYDQGCIIRGPLAAGFLSGKYTPDNLDALMSAQDFRMRSRDHYLKVMTKLDLLREVLTSGGRTPAQGALAWIWARSERTVPIPGFRTAAQVEENVCALDFGPLTPDQMAQIDQILQRNREVQS